MNPKRKENIRKNEISVLRTYQLGGYEQQILLEGRAKELPLVLCLHGGPGAPIPFSVGCRGLYPEFTDKFIMVYWDQIGCGINHYKIDDSFTVETFKIMTIQLITILKKEFPNNKLLLFATSWGSALSAFAVAESPFLLDGVVVYGQLLHHLILCNEVKNAVSLSEAPRKVKLNVEKIFQQNGVQTKNLKKILNIILKYTDGYRNKNSRQLSLVQMAWGMLNSPDYKWKDFLAVIINGYTHNENLLKEIVSLDMTSILQGVKKPYIIIQGETDIITSTRDVIEFVSSSNNNNLHDIVIKNAGHLPSQYGMCMILKQLEQLANR